MIIDYFTIILFKQKLNESRQRSPCKKENKNK